MEAPSDAYSFAAFLVEKAPALLGWAVAFLVMAGALYAASKIGPPIMRAMQNSNDSIGAAAATFESMEASLTSTLDTQTKEIRSVMGALKHCYQRLKTVEEKLDRLLGETND